MIKENKISFLLGAGASIPSSMPSTSEITEKVLKGKYAYISSRFIEVGNIEQYSWNPENAFVNRIRDFLSVLKQELGNHYSFSGRELNYEDYYYLVDSLYEDENMNFENPLVAQYGDQLIKNHKHLFTPIDKQLYEIRLIDLCSKAKDFISDIVVSQLSRTPSTTNQLQFLLDAYKENRYNQYNVFTLNHDTIIEKLFNESNQKYSDGFTRIDGECKVWDKTSFVESILLIKLHGSVNWYYESGNDWYDDRICIYDEPLRDNSQPLIQIGSFNKIHQYNRGIYFQLQCLFSKLLAQSDTIIITGYGFGDQGINNRIIDWVYSDRNKKIIIIHPNPEKLKSQARPAILGKWDPWLNSGTMKIISKYIQDVTWSEINDEVYK